VSIIVPFRDGAALLERCVGSIAQTAGYERFEVLLVDNASWEPETQMTVRALCADSRMRLLHDPADFNWSDINNRAAQSAAGELLLFMNSDVEGRSRGWLSAMVEHALRPEVGPVGARLLYPDGRVQHAGVIVGFGGRAEHAFRFCPGDSSGYRGLAKLQRNCAAVTGACLMVRRSLFAELGGFDGSFAVAFNDVDFCMRARKEGYLVVYTPYAELVHHESATRGVSTDNDEAAALIARWGSVLAADPYFNPNLSRWRAEFALPRASERAS
jgi:GT2 family glycosyltransferase